MNRLLLWQDATLFWGVNDRAVTEHQHPMVQWVMGVAEPFFWKDPDGEWMPRQGFLVTPNHRHECDARGREMLIVDLDPEGSFGDFVARQHLRNTTILDFCPQIDVAAWRNWLHTQNYAALREALEKVFGYQHEASPNPPQTDTRIMAVKSHIRQHLQDTLSTKTLMDVAHLSESRLLHKFKEEVGLPIRNYIHWCRLQATMQHLKEGRSLTEVAHLVGFADQAHLTRTFVRSIGVPPSTLIKNSKFVQVSFPG